MAKSLTRWLIFNSVGVLGFLVQLASLTLLAGWLRWKIMPATALAVEIAVVHNFVWHERWTWADRADSAWTGVVKRFLQFNLTNGLVSLTGNVLFTVLFLDTLPVNYIAANTLAIAVCSMVNYFLCDRLVFQAPACKSRAPNPAGGRQAAARLGEEKIS
jgi:putative flippase GtrA